MIVSEGIISVSPWMAEANSPSHLINLCGILRGELDWETRLKEITRRGGGTPGYFFLGGPPMKHLVA